MNFLDIALLVFATYFFAFFITFLLYQFGKIKLRESAMIHWCRANEILETILLIITRFVSFGVFGKFGLAAFYVLTIILLILQCIYAEFGFGRKLLDGFWILFYVFLFLIDICDISVAQIIGQVQSSEDFIAIDSFLKDSFFGQLIIAGVAPAIRILIIEAVNKNSK